MLKFFRKVLCMILAVVMIAGIAPRVEAQAATTPAKVTEGQVAHKMGTVMKFVGKYFTTYGSNGEKPCQNYYTSGHGCSDCGTSKLINSSWIKNTFGLTASSVSNLPSFRFAPNGSMAQPCSSCVAFATMVHWFLYAQNSTDKVTVSQIVQKGTFNSETFSKAKVGDIITMVSGSDHYHTMIFVSLKSNGVEVIDCNWNGANVGSTKVQKRVHYFSNSNGCTVTINRAINYTQEHVCSYNNNGYCTGCGKDYLETSSFSSTKDVVSGKVTPLTTERLHVRTRPYAASTWPDGSSYKTADYANMEYTCKNHYGNLWYYVKYYDNYYKTYGYGYVYNEEVDFDNEQYSNNIIADCYLASKFGGKITEGTSLWAKNNDYGGSIRSGDGTTKLTKVVFGIYNTDGSLTASKNQVTKTNVNATSYTINSSDDTIEFSSLSQGNYIFKIYGYDVHGKSSSASFNFTVVKSGTTTYTVSYNANGGSGAPSSQTKIKDTTLTLSAQQPTRDGYTFLGWATSSSATSAQYQPGGSYTNNASVTLYAVWRAQTYTISYDANGGSGAPAAQTKAFGYALALSTQVPTRSGYAFLGWATSSSATSAQYQPGDIYSTNANLKLYAVWKTQTYTVSYNANGGSGAPVAQTKTYDVALKLSTQQPTRDGYTFLGWATSSSATSAQYQPGGSYTSNANVTLYAVWQKNAPVTYTVSYNANGGSGAPAAQTKTHDVALKLSTQQPTRDGYTFLGWATSSSATSAQYQPGGSYTSNANVTLYAVWQMKDTNAPTITVATVNGSAGKEVTVGISIENNPGIAGMTFALDYDKTRIELVGYEDSGMKGWTIGVENAGASWAEIADYTDNGEILKLKFRVLDNAADGMAHIRIIELETFNSDEKEVKTVAASGSVNVINRFPGDINDDGKVDIRDAIRLAKYLAKENVEINLSNANVNGDDKVDVRDLIRLKKYLAKMPVTLV